MSNGSSIYLSFPLLSSFYASDKNSFFRGERKKKKEKKKRKRKNERIKDSRKSFATVLVMTDKKKEREREERRREEDEEAWSYLVLSELGRFYRHAANRSLKTLDERRRDRHRYIHLSIYTTLRDKTANFRKASVFLRDVHSSGLKWRIPLERRPEKDESTRARPSAVPRQPYRRRANQPVTRSYVPRGVHDEWVEKARLETE